MGLLKSFLNKPEVAAMHTNDMAKVADGDKPSFGATSAQSFRQRMRIERNRQHVGSYREANMHHVYRSDARQVAGDQPSHQSTPTHAVKPAPTFREPSTRKYNPFK